MFRTKGLGNAIPTETKDPGRSNRFMTRIHRIVTACGIAAFLLGAGCDNLTPITYGVSTIVKDEAGAVSINGPAGSGTVKKRNAVGTSVTVVSEGQSIEVKVAEIQSDALVFDISHPIHTVEHTKIDRGQSKDVYPGGEKLGVRISVK